MCEVTSDRYGCHGATLQHSYMAFMELLGATTPLHLTGIASMEPRYPIQLQSMQNNLIPRSLDRVDMDYLDANSRVHTRMPPNPCCNGLTSLHRQAADKF